MAKYMINDEIFDTRKAKKICKYERFEFLFGTVSVVLYKSKSGKYYKEKKHKSGVGALFNIDKLATEISEGEVRSVLKEQNKIRAYEKYFGKLKNV